MTERENRQELQLLVNLGIIDLRLIILTFLAGLSKTQLTKDLCHGQYDADKHSQVTGMLISLQHRLAQAIEHHWPDELWENFYPSLARKIEANKQQREASGLSSLSHSSLPDGYHALMKVTGRFSFKQASLTHSKEFVNFPPEQAIKAINSILNHQQLPAQEREFWLQLKHALLKQEKNLADAVIYSDLACSRKKLKKTLREMSYLSEHTKINHHIEKYFQTIVAQTLENHYPVFRKSFDKCSSPQELRTLLADYPDYDPKLSNQYRVVRLIRKLKQTLEQFEEIPEEIDATLVEIFPKHHEINLRSKLRNILCGEIAESVYRQVLKEDSLAGLRSTLAKINEEANTPQAQSVVRPLHIILQTFMEKPESHTSFAEVESSLNFLPSKLQNKIIVLLRTEIQRELQQRVEQLLASSQGVLEKFRHFHRCLQDPRYDKASLTIYGHSLEEFRRGIESGGENIFDWNKIPTSVLSLMTEAQKEQERCQEQNVQNCHKRVQKIQKKLQEGFSLNVARTLINLFQRYGQTNFAKSQDNNSLNGYAIAREIGLFYQNPQRETIHLPEDTIPSIRSLVTQLLNQERHSQLVKLQKSSFVTTTTTSPAAVSSSVLSKQEHQKLASPLVRRPSLEWKTLEKLSALELRLMVALFLAGLSKTELTKDIFYGKVKEECYAEVVHLLEETQEKIAKCIQRHWNDQSYTELYQLI